MVGGDGSRISVFIIYTIIARGPVAASAFIDNIPCTSSMLPVVAVIAENFNTYGDVSVHPDLLCFGLLVGATHSGNITPIGASSNITGLSLLRRDGCEVSSGEFMKHSVPFTLTAVTVGYVLLWVIRM